MKKQKKDFRHTLRRILFVEYIARFLTGVLAGIFLAYAASTALGRRGNFGGEWLLLPLMVL